MVNPIPGSRENLQYWRGQSAPRDETPTAFVKPANVTKALDENANLAHSGGAPQPTRALACKDYLWLGLEHIEPSLAWQFVNSSRPLAPEENQFAGWLKIK